MKTLTKLAAALLIVLSTSAFASGETEKLSMDYTIQTYIAAASAGKLNSITDILDYDVKYTVNRKDRIQTYGRDEIVRLFNLNKDVEQNCKTEFSIIEQNANQAIAKVCMKYEGFTKVNLLSMAKTSKGWKITNISSSFN